MARKHTTTAPARKTKRLDLLPYPDFPLSPHPASKRWYKTAKGKRYYLGPLDRPEDALAEWMRIRHYAMNGLAIPSRGADTSGGDFVTLGELVNTWLTEGERRVKTGELSPRTFRDHLIVGELVVKRWGRERRADSLTAEEFANLRADLAGRYGPDSVNKRVYLIRAIFNYGHANRSLGLPAPDFGTSFTKMAERVVEKARQDRLDPTLTADQLRAVLDSANVTMRAAVLLGVNAAFGNSDIGTLPRAAVDLDAAIVEYPRPKTLKRRRAALWPETVEAIRAMADQRPQPATREDARLLFLTKTGLPFVREETRIVTKGPNTGKEQIVPTDAIAQEFDRLLEEHNLKQRGRSFYCLRHCFRSVADDLPDRVAVDLVMGHAKREDVARFYRHADMDDRLRLVADHVHNWLFGKPAKRSRGKR